MPNRKVAHSVVEMVVSVADRCGVPLPSLCEGLPVDERALRRRLAGLEWELFVELAERLEARLGRDHLLAQLTRLPDISPIGLELLRRFVSPRLLLGFVSRVVGPAMYPMYTTRYEELEQDDGALVGHVSMQLDAGLRGSAVIFDMHVAAMTALPSFIGRPPFVVRAETTDRSCELHIELRPPAARQRDEARLDG